MHRTLARRSMPGLRPQKLILADVKFDKGARRCREWLLVALIGRVSSQAMSSDTSRDEPQ
jgi:hypothetical protein